MSKKELRNSIIKWAVIFLLVYLAYIWQQDTVDKALAIIKNMPVSSTIMAAIMSLVYFFFEGAIISRMTMFEKNKMTLWQGICCGVYCAFYKAATLGSASGFAEIYYMNSCGVPVSKGTGMTLTQYTFQKIAIGLMGAVSFVTLLLTHEKGITKYADYMALGLVAITVIVAFLMFLAASKWLADLILKLARKILKEGSRFHDKLELIETNVTAFNEEGRNILGRKKEAVIFLLLNILKLFSWYTIPWIVLSPEYELNPVRIVMLMALTNMLGVVMIAPAGLGTLEFVFITVFTTFITNESAAAAAILYRFYSLIFPFIIGAFFVAANKKSRNAAKNAELVDIEEEADLKNCG